MATQSSIEPVWSFSRVDAVAASRRVLLFLCSMDVSGFASELRATLPHGWRNGLIRSGDWPRAYCGRFGLRAPDERFALAHLLKLADRTPDELRGTAGSIPALPPT